MARRLFVHTALSDEIWFDEEVEAIMPLKSSYTNSPVISYHCARSLSTIVFHQDTTVFSEYEEGRGRSIMVVYTTMWSVSTANVCDRTLFINFQSDYDSVRE